MNPLPGQGSLLSGLGFLDLLKRVEITGWRAGTVPVLLGKCLYPMTQRTVNGQSLFLIVELQGKGISGPGGLEGTRRQRNVSESRVAEEKLFRHLFSGHDAG